MEIIILKTNINSREEFKLVKNDLKNSYRINECTIDLEDIDKVVRVIGENINTNEVVKGITRLGYNCEELPE